MNRRQDYVVHGVFLACSQTFYYILIEFVERAYENKNHGGFIEQKHEGVEVGKLKRSKWTFLSFHFFPFFSFYLAVRARSRPAYLLEVHYQAYESSHCGACQFFL